MKIWFSIWILLAAACAQASEFSDYVPDDWRIIGSARGDLNHDLRADAVIVLQKQGGNDGDEFSDGYPRMVKVLLAEDDGTYREIVRNRSIIRPAEQKDGICVNDSFAGIDIDKGRLKIKSVCRFRGAGKRLFEDNERIYRYEDGKMRLIGEESVFYLQGSKERDISTRSVNFLTGRRKVVIGDYVFKKNKQGPKIRRSKMTREKHYLNDDVETKPDNPFIQTPTESPL